VGIGEIAADAGESDAGDGEGGLVAALIAGPGEDGGGGEDEAVDPHPARITIAAAKPRIPDPRHLTGRDA
jgi:hypothetical protein